jgi:FPC/CPF motif-containing protein YcgG
VNYYEERQQKAGEALAALLAKPPIPADGMYSDGECFNPWDLFPCVYGSYSSEFDDMAIAVLSDIRDRTFNRTDLAAEMFREMLCKGELCDYGTSPRVCFASPALKERLPQLIERWREYSQIQWSR